MNEPRICWWRKLEGRSSAVATVTATVEGVSGEMPPVKKKFKKLKRKKGRKKKNQERVKLIGGWYEGTRCPSPWVLRPCVLQLDSGITTAMTSFRGFFRD